MVADVTAELDTLKKSKKYFIELDNTFPKAEETVKKTNREIQLEDNITDNRRLETEF